MKKDYKIQNFTKKEFVNIYKSHLNNPSLFLCSPKELNFLSETSPYEANEISNQTGFPVLISQKSRDYQARALAPYLVLTIDNSLFKGITNENMTRSKVKNMNKMYSLLNLKSPFSEEDVNKGNILEMSYYIKKNVLDLASRFDKNPESTILISNPNPKGFEGFFKELIGDNLKSILLYGSSMDGNGKDYDLMINVGELSLDLYNKIWDKQKNIQSDKPVSIALMPERYFNQNAECDSQTFAISKSGKLLYGKPVKFPVIDEKDAIEKSYYKSGKEFTSLRNSLLGGVRLESLVKSPEFLKETLKLEIWARKALLQRRIGKFLTKNEFLRIEPVEIPDFGKNPPWEKVYDALLDANFRVK